MAKGTAKGTANGELFSTWKCLRRLSEREGSRSPCVPIKPFHANLEKLGELPLCSSLHSPVSSALNGIDVASFQPSVGTRVKWKYADDKQRTLMWTKSSTVPSCGATHNISCFVKFSRTYPFNHLRRKRKALVFVVFVRSFLWLVDIKLNSFRLPTSRGSMSWVDARLDRGVWFGAARVTLALLYSLI